MRHSHFGMKRVRSLVLKGVAQIACQGNIENKKTGRRKRTSKKSIPEIFSPTNLRWLNGPVFLVANLLLVVQDVVAFAAVWPLVQSGAIQ